MEISRYYYPMDRAISRYHLRKNKSYVQLMKPIREKNYIGDYNQKPSHVVPQKKHQMVAIYSLLENKQIIAPIHLCGVFMLTRV